jgi:hypothetical protein
MKVPVTIGQILITASIDTEQVYLVLELDFFVSINIIVRRTASATPCHIKCTRVNATTRK